MKDVQVIILAAGMGTRLDKPHPKCLTHIPDGRTIMQQQIDNIRETLGADTQIIIVVGFQAEKIIEEHPEEHFVYNENYDSTNTSKSLLKALRTTKPRKHTLWMNGDVVFNPQILTQGLSLVEESQSYVTVNTDRVAEEEIKYTTGVEGFITELSKTIPANKALGEAVGINFIASQDKPALIKHLQKVAPQDYFEKGMENAIGAGELHIEPLSISGTGLNAVEVDFEEDLAQVYKIFA